jgi:uncharacterized protein (TIGR01244 family)
MKKLFLIVCGFTVLAGTVLAAEDAAVAISITDIHADTSVLDGVRFVSTGQPDKETLEIAKNAGFVAVIDLREESEDRGIDEAAEVEALGMSYFSLPVAGADDVTFENSGQLNKMLSEIDGPVLLHCASGNRVGALFALRASQAGASDDDALAAGKAAGLTRLESVVAERLQEH